MINMINFKNQAAVELYNEAIKIVVLPNIGGKIASIYHRNSDFEFVFQNRENRYKTPKIYSSFAEFDASGFDDAFPTIDEGEVCFQGKSVKYPDHGEIWSSAFEIVSLEADKVVLQYKSQILPYAYKKTIRLLENNEIKISYNIKNNGKDDLPCIFAAHYLVNCHKDMEICFPRGARELVIVQPSAELGPIGTVYDYNDMETRKKLCHIHSQEANNTEKYYVNHKIQEGRCSIKYHHVNLEYVLEYDKEKLPYLGFWVTEGGFRGDYNCALEPSTGFYDSIDIAKKNDKLAYIKANSNFEFDISVIIKE